MKLYGAPKPAPNPRRVRMFLAEKGIALEETPVDLMTREHKSEGYRAKNSLGQVPTLELDDGTTISETVAICRYFEELHPDRPCSARPRSKRRGSTCGCAAWSSS
jgi:glutathione S-transferase